MIFVPGMFMVGASARNLGKTTFACALIERFGRQQDVIGVKVTTVDAFNESHHRKLAHTARFLLVEEQARDGKQDTARMLDAGAKRALWLRVREEHLEEGVGALLDTLGATAVSVCESSRARRFVEPGTFVMLRAATEEQAKHATDRRMQEADRIVVSDGSRFDVDMNDIQLLGGCWAIKMNATAILLAGGRSTRMGRDKTLLPFGGKPMIQHIYEQLCPHFRNVLVSSNDPSRHAFLGAPIVRDERQGAGPLGGIVSALKASSDAASFVVACDTPTIDVTLVKSLIRRLGRHDVAAACKPRSLPEPLFAVYAKSALPVLEQMLSSGEYRMADVLARCRVRRVACTDRRIENINTMREYRRRVGEVVDGDT